MRKIVFRGKRVDNGEWIYGSLVVFDNDTYILSGFDACRGLEHCLYEGCGMDEVIPETVGQYVGLKDRDGMKIFEGDILESPIKRVDQSHGNLIIINDIRKCEFAALYVAEYKVFGNIHDNSELLEGTKHERDRV